MKRPRDHEGVDYRVGRGTTVVAPASGTVMKAVDKISKANRRSKWRCNHEILIHHTGRAKGFRTRYCHLGKLFVGFGDTVADGQPIATVGQCGSGPPDCVDHLHFEVVRDWIRKDPEEMIGGCISKGEEVLSEDRPLYHPLKC